MRWYSKLWSYMAYTCIKFEIDGLSRGSVIIDSRELKVRGACSLLRTAEVCAECCIINRSASWVFYENRRRRCPWRTTIRQHAAHPPPDHTGLRCAARTTCSNSTSSSSSSISSRVLLLVSTVQVRREARLRFSLNRHNFFINQKTKHWSSSRIILETVVVRRLRGGGGELY